VTPRVRTTRRVLRGGWRWLAGLVAGVSIAASVLVACSRHADIVDEPDAAYIPPSPRLDAGDIPMLDSGLDTDAFPACEERPVGDCVGSNDFLCAFAHLLDETAEACQRETGCKTDGWIQVDMGGDGCVAALGMTDPNEAIVKCLLEKLGSVRCPCREESRTYFFGIDNDGCAQTCSLEFPCPDGELCVDGHCFQR
jgi:hypothetical protein